MTMHSISAWSEIGHAPNRKKVSTAGSSMIQNPLGAGGKGWAGQVHTQAIGFGGFVGST